MRGLAIVALALAACGGGSGPPPISIWEVEPNDTEETAQDLGVLVPGDAIEVVGVGDDGAGDLFRIEAGADLRLRVRLHTTDLACYDGSSGSTTYPPPLVVGEVFTMHVFHCADSPYTVTFECLAP